jgi:5'-nucleotidase
MGAFAQCTICHMRPLVLITNDDGVRSPGLHALAECVDDIADVLIVAPYRQQTSASRSKKRAPGDGEIHETLVRVNNRDVVAYGVVGTPAIAVLHGVLQIAPRMPDLCLSGINYGENIGYALTTGGTIGAALEAGAFGIPAVAVSYETPIEANHTEDYPKVEWDVPRHFSRIAALHVLQHGLPSEVGMLNLNIPTDANLTTEIRWTRQSAHNYYQWTRQGAPQTGERVTIRVNKVVLNCETDSDVQAIAVDRVVSITPLLRNLTALRVLNDVPRLVNSG